MKMRNLSICPLTPDPPEVLELIAELKEYLKTVEYQDAGINEAYFTFEYNGTTYRMDNYALSTPADNLFMLKTKSKAGCLSSEPLISDRGEKRFMTNYWLLHFAGVILCTVFVPQLSETIWPDPYT